MYASQYMEEKMINVMRGTSFAAISNCYLALWEGNPGNDGSGGAEASYTGYARKKITFEQDQSVSGQLTLSNKAEIIFQNTSATTPTITHVAVFTATTGGNMLLYGPLTTSVVNEGGVKFEIGNISWTLSGCLSDATRKSLTNPLIGTQFANFTPYAALYYGDPNQGGTEVSGGSYARANITKTGMVAPTIVNNQAYTSLGTAVTFATPTADWGTVDYVAITIGSSGNVFAAFPLNAVVTILSSDVVTIPVGSLDLYIG